MSYIISSTFVFPYDIWHMIWTSSFDSGWLLFYQDIVSLLSSLNIPLVSDASLLVAIIFVKTNSHYLKILWYFSLFLSYEIVSPADNAYGSLEDDGTWNGMVGMVMSNVSKRFMFSVVPFIPLF